MQRELLFAILLTFGCESPVITQETETEVASAAVSETRVSDEIDGGEVDEEPAAPPAIAAHEAMGRRRLNSITSRSPRLLTARITDVQRAPSSHSARIVRWMPEAEIIRADSGITDPERLIDLTVLVLARMGVSEANWGCVPTTSDPGELARLYQVLRTNRRSDETLLNTMRNHGRIVSEVYRPQDERERWLVGLNLELTRPEAFPEDEQAWDTVFRPRWEEALSEARRLVEGQTNGRPCRVPLRTWGGRCDRPGGACDDPIARGRGLVPVETCGGHNRYWASPERFSQAAAQAEVQLALRQDRTPEPLLVAIASGHEAD